MASYAPLSAVELDSNDQASTHIDDEYSTVNLDREELRILVKTITGQQIKVSLPPGWVAIVGFETWSERRMVEHLQSEISRLQGSS